MTFSKTRMAATGSGMEDGWVGDDCIGLSAEGLFRCDGEGGGEAERGDDDHEEVVDRWRHRSAITGCWLGLGMSVIMVIGCV